jgi:hypothetical protein
MRGVSVALRIRKEELPSYLSAGWLHVRDLPAPPRKPSRQPWNASSSGRSSCVLRVLLAEAAAVRPGVSRGEQDPLEDR